MSQNVATAFEHVKTALLADEELAARVRNAKTAAEQSALWNDPRFRALHDRAMGGIDPARVSAWLGELGDAELDRVAGGLGDTATHEVGHWAGLYVSALQAALAAPPKTP